MRDRPLQSPPDRGQNRRGVQALQPGLLWKIGRTRRRFGWGGNSVMNSLGQSAQAIMGLGYTARESEFLYLVATHSGFFVQRQFAAYIGISGRGPVTDFIKKAL